MSKYLVKQAGKAVGSIALAITGFVIAAYAMHHASGWLFALSLVVAVIGTIPAVLFFNLFPAPGAKSPRGKKFPFPMMVVNRTDDVSPWNANQSNKHHDFK